MTYVRCGCAVRPCPRSAPSSGGRDEVEEAVREMLSGLGEDVGREGATGVKHVCFKSSTTCKGREAATQQADRMFNQNAGVCENSVVKYYVPKDVVQEGNRLHATDLVNDAGNAWNVRVDSHTPANQKNKLAIEGRKEAAYKDANLELVEGVNEFEQKSLEDDPGLPLTNKKMVKRMCNGYYVTCTEMSSVL